MTKKEELKEYNLEYKRFSLARNFKPADLITIFNGFCGVTSILCVLRLLASLDSPSLVPTMSQLKTQQVIILRNAFKYPFYGLCFDIFDGRVARWTGLSSLLGQQLDSLADLISFGVSPAVLGYLFGLRTDMDLIVLALFVCAGIARLGRFNVTAHLIPDKSK